MVFAVFQYTAGDVAVLAFHRPAGDRSLGACHRRDGDRRPVRRGIVWLSLVAARTRNWALQRRLGKAEKRAATAEDQLAATSAGTDTDQKQPPSRRLS